MDKESRLKLFLMGILMLSEEEEETTSSCTPNSLTPPPVLYGTLPEVLQVLELWPMFPQCEHFLPILITATTPL
ncbi:UNVERIFIED_CONTAM: hypothetical protein Sradi_4343200 [Sesamum radiatum]|uniref:Uncharacterized protein n=1 Tax=Sesamum radiatum TaxID=300843 RepID=A0AAW2NNP0_SESRA